MSAHDRDMDCEELVELTTEYLEDALEASERTRLEEHLAGCDGCTVYLEQMRTTIRISGMLTGNGIPAEGREELLRVFRAWRSGSQA